MISDRHIVINLVLGLMSGALYLLLRALGFVPDHALLGACLIVVSFKLITLWAESVPHGH